jgi:hypothetical protein
VQPFEWEPFLGRNHLCRRLQHCSAEESRFAGEVQLCAEFRRLFGEQKYRRLFHARLTLLSSLTAFPAKKSAAPPPEKPAFSFGNEPPPAGLFKFTGRVLNVVAAGSPYAQGDLICFHARHIWQIWREPEVRRSRQFAASRHNFWLAGALFLMEQNKSFGAAQSRAPAIANG